MTGRRDLSPPAGQRPRRPQKTGLLRRRVPERPGGPQGPGAAARVIALCALAATLSACALYRTLPALSGNAASSQSAPAPPAAPSPSLTRAQATASLAEARGLIDKRDYPSARGSLRAVVPAAEQASWLDIDSDANFVVGETLDRERASREAANAYARAHAASRRLGDRSREIRDLNALSNALLDAGAHDRASVAATEASALAVHAGDVRAEATAQNNIAEAHRLAGRLDAARAGYDRALALARQSGDPAAITSILINLGSTERRAGRLTDARARFAEAQDLAKSLNDPRAGEYVQWHLEQIEAELATRGGTQ